eukprot:TRINITY_DN6955_c0_g1_i1.p2 TRINITY_DN6955_c0_g1~~TRINITY_DN6955_c0_g1_i1.p2  ORF type:complete len:171 (+),score=-34.73 TRINITY_DN6955_c0_g1_i1:93-605(+)
MKKQTRRNALFLEAGAQRLGEVQNAAAHLRIGNAIVSTHQFQRLALGHGVHVHARRFLGQTRDQARRQGFHFLGHIVEEKADGNIQNTRKIEQTRSTDTIGAALVLLDLLEGQAQGFTQLFLAHAKQGTAQTHTGTHMHIDGVGLTRRRTAAAGVATGSGFFGQFGGSSH